MQAQPRSRSHSRTRRTAVAALLCGALALGSAACGPSGGDTKTKGPFGELTGSQILDKAMAATKSAKSLTVAVDITSEGEPLKAHLSLDTAKKCAGTLSVGVAGTAEIVKADDRDVYLRLDEALLRDELKDESPEMREAALEQLGGRWTKSPVTDPDTRDMVAFCDLKDLLADFEEGAAGTVRGEETTVDGRKALKLTESGGGETNTAYVATEGTPYLLKVVTTGGTEPGTITFSRYDEPVAAKTPAPKDVVDLG
ncbi:hypothetical protein ACIQCR_24330 [Streptomyces sp. NPDC093249]|uniref:hypothetical protein n=1 Tax=unclassified Streptomyces TaxID=2593676 RepID=UPI00382DA06B